MTSIQIYNKAISAKDIRSILNDYLLAKINDKHSVFEAMARQGNYYGENCFPTRYYSGGLSAPEVRRKNVTRRQKEDALVPLMETPNRYSVVYLLKDQHHHLGCATPAQARVILGVLHDDPERMSLGVYDDKTELFEWDSALRDEYEKASMKEQGVRGQEIINIAKALRRRDSSWDSNGFQRPTFFS